MSEKSKVSGGFGSVEMILCIAVGIFFCVLATKLQDYFEPPGTSPDEVSARAK